MAVTTSKGLAKLAMAEMLKSRGFVVWRCFSKMKKVYGMLLIACNKLNPDDPYRYYRYLTNELCRLPMQTTTQSVRYKEIRQERVDSLRRELAALTNDQICPCCNKSWDADSLVPEIGDHIAIPPR